MGFIAKPGGAFVGSNPATGAGGTDEPTQTEAKVNQLSKSELVSNPYLSPTISKGASGWTSISGPREWTVGLSQFLSK